MTEAFSGEARTQQDTRRAGGYGRERVYGAVAGSYAPAAPV